jgi:hypothetical protein
MCMEILATVCSAAGHKTYTCYTVSLVADPLWFYSSTGQNLLSEFFLMTKTYLNLLQLRVMLKI